MFTDQSLTFTEDRKNNVALQVAGSTAVYIPVTRARRSTPAKSACSMAMTPAAPKSCSG